MNLWIPLNHGTIYMWPGEKLSVLREDPICWSCVMWLCLLLAKVIKLFIIISYFLNHSISNVICGILCEKSFQIGFIGYQNILKSLLQFISCDTV
jgi:hypothetical protein